MTERSENDEARISLLGDNRLFRGLDDNSDSFGRNSCRACLIAGTVIVIIGCALGFGLYYGLKDDSDCGCSLVEEQSCPELTCDNSSALGNYCSQSQLGIYQNYSISTDSEPCAAIGK